MKMTGLKEYKSNSKQKSRRMLASALWNRLRNVDGKIVYLPGPVADSDHQRKMLINYGFKNEDIIGVDYGENVGKARKLGGYCIEGKLEEVLQSWGNVKIKAVLADLCGGYNKSTCDVYDAVGAVVKRQKQGLVCYFNMQRGRESGNYAWNIKDCQSFIQEALKPIRHEVSSKHRGLEMWVDHVLNPFKDLATGQYSLRTRDDLARLSAIVKDTDFRIFTYKNPKLKPNSNPVTMDSVLFNWAWYMGMEPLPKNKKVVHRIAATLATATRQSL